MARNIHEYIACRDYGTLRAAKNLIQYNPMPDQRKAHVFCSKMSIKFLFRMKNHKIVLQSSPIPKISEKILQPYAILI